MDPLELRAEAGALLDEYGLAGADAWLFAEDNLERLRYDIDPAWYGEAPRNYLYDAAGARSGFSGKLDEQKVRDWLSLERSRGDRKVKLAPRPKPALAARLPLHTGAINQPA